MSSLIDNMKKTGDEIVKLQNELQLNINNLASIKAHNGQQGYSLTINGVNIPVSKCDNLTYSGTLIRGRDMIHLGCIKAVNGVIDQLEARLKKKKIELKNIAEQIS